MSKFIDLEPQVSAYYGTTPGQERRAGICDALRYLDSHPERVRGRTITESELGEVTRTHESIRDLVNLLDITIVPDPEPTNVEKLKGDLSKWTGDIETCVGLGLADHLASQGWTKVPGGDDD